MGNIFKGPQTRLPAPVQGAGRMGDPVRHGVHPATVFVVQHRRSSGTCTGNTKGITVAIANNDDGTDNNALIGKQNLGDQIVKQMRSNDQLGWTFVTEAEAMDQVESGKAYAAIIIPKDFSDDLAGVVTGGKSRPTPEYYVNEKPAPSPPKSPTSARPLWTASVNSTFVSTVSEVLTEVIQYG